MRIEMRVGLIHCDCCTNDEQAILRIIFTMIESISWSIVLLNMGKLCLQSAACIVSFSEAMKQARLCPSSKWHYFLCKSVESVIC